MKKPFCLLVVISSMIFASNSCKKNPDTSIQCTGVSANGRIIGYDPCLNYLTFNKVQGAGFVIEVNNGSSKDTVVTYDIPEGLFNFLPQYKDGSYSSYLFRPEVQDLFKIKFNYRLAKDNEKTFVVCGGTINWADFLAAVKEREIITSCIASN